MKFIEKVKKEWYTEEVAKNPNTPAAILRHILLLGRSDGVSCYAVENLNCPIDALKMALERGDGVSYWAAKNPNCPIEARIKWEKIVTSTSTGDFNYNGKILEIF